MPVDNVASIRDLYSAKIASQNKLNNSAISVDSFLSLIASQLQNQDMMNPMKDTEFMGQMAQFSNLQMMQAMMAQNSNSLAISMIGKEAEAAFMDNGKLTVVKGSVERVTLFEGKPMVYIKGQPFSLEEIMVVGSTSEEIPAADPKTTS